MAKPWKIPYLNPGRNLRVCLFRVLGTRVRETFSYEQGTIEGTDPEALHNMRVSSRRLQAVLNVFQDCFSRKEFEHHRKRIRSLIRGLGGVRDSDVFLGILETHRQNLSDGDRKAIDLLIAREKNRRLQQRKVLLQTLTDLRREHYAEEFVKFLQHSLASD